MPSQRDNGGTLPLSSLISELLTALHEEGHRRATLADSTIRLPIQQGGWSLNVEMFCVGDLLTVQLAMPIVTAPGRQMAVCQCVAQINATLSLPGVYYSSDLRYLSYRVATVVSHHKPSVRTVLDIAQTCVSTSITAMPALAAAALGPHAAQPVAEWLTSTAPSPSSLNDSLSDPLSEQVRPKPASQHIDWQFLAISGLLGRLARDANSPWLAHGWTLLLQADRCVGAWHGERAYLLTDTGVADGERSLLHALLTSDDIRVVQAVQDNAAIEPDLLDCGLVVDSEQLLVGRSLDGLTPPPRDIRLAPVAPSRALPELSALVPEVPADTDGGTWMVLESRGQAIGLALIHTDHVSGVGSLGFFGMTPQARGRGLGAACHRLLLFALGGLGCTEYRDACSKENTAMLHIFAGNGCSPYRQLRWYRRPASHNA